MAAMGVDRVNLGVQTFTPHVQARIGRIQPLDMVERAVGQLRAAGIATGFDLMYGLPGQIQDDLAATLEATIAIHPSTAENTSDLQSPMRTTYAVFCVKQKT